MPTTKSLRGKEMKTLLIVVSLSLIGAAAAFGQGPDAGMLTRSIKALSDQQASDLREGRAMGLALAAELNGIRVRRTCWNWPTNWI
jgi:hypothetical protein